jgi:hypothetical protein
MSPYLQSLISPTERLAAPARRDAAHAFEQDLVVDAPAPGTAFPAASTPVLRFPEAGPAASHVQQPALEAPAGLRSPAAALAPALGEAAGWMPQGAPDRARMAAAPSQQDSADRPATHTGRITPEERPPRQSFPEAHARPPAERSPARQAAAELQAGQESRPPSAMPDVRPRNNAASMAHAEAGNQEPAAPSPEQRVEVHIGAVVLNVEPPPAAALLPAVPAAAVAPPAPKPEVDRRNGARFSASRHYLRWT